MKKSENCVLRNRLGPLFLFHKFLPLASLLVASSKLLCIFGRTSNIGLSCGVSCFFAACGRRFYDRLSAMLVLSASVILWRKDIYDGCYTPRSVPGPLYRLPFMWMDWCCPSRVRHASLRCVTSRPLPRDSPCMLSLPSPPCRADRVHRAVPDSEHFLGGPNR